jgi:cell division protein FtsW
MLITLILLLGAGMAFVYSSSLLQAREASGRESSFLVKQIAAMAVGLVCAFVVTLIDYRLWRRNPIPPLFLAIVSGASVLVMVPGIGQESYGASRWIRVGADVTIQPSEFAKLALIIFMAATLSRSRTRIKSFRAGFIPALLPVAALSVLFMVQKDLGTTIVTAMIAGSIIWVAGARLSHLAIVTPAVLAAGAAAIYFTAFRSSRFWGWWNPESASESVRWHTDQTLRAFGLGGWTGVGLGWSNQKAFWLPNPHTDSILAIVGEEAGFVGTTALLVLLGLLSWRAATIAVRAKDRFGQLLALGIAAMFAWQTVLNAAAVTDLVPYTGVPLPLISYGGSSLLVSLVSIGLLVRISRDSGPELDEDEPAETLELPPRGRETLALVPGR